MKKTFILFLIPALSFGQNKGDNVIISKDTTAGLAAFKKAFKNEGFAIEKDTDNYLSTEVLSKGWYGMKFIASKDGDSITLKSYLRSDVSLMGVRNDNLILADLKGSGSAANRVTFQSLYDLVEKTSKNFYSKKE